MQKFGVRRATARDIDTLVEHRHRMFEEMSHSTAEELMVLDESYRRWAREQMKRRLFHAYVVTAGRGKVAASGCVWLREVQPSPGQAPGLVPYVMSVYTLPEFRRNGLASMVLREATEWARKKGYAKTVLHASSVGRKVYARLGWKRTWEMEFRLERP